MSGLFKQIATTIKKNDPRRRTRELTGRDPFEDDEAPLKRARRKKAGSRKGGRASTVLTGDKLGG